VIRFSKVVDIHGPPELANGLAEFDRHCGASGLTNLFGGGPQDQPVRYATGTPERRLLLRIRSGGNFGRKSPGIRCCRSLGDGGSNGRSNGSGKGSSASSLVLGGTSNRDRFWSRNLR